MLEKIKEDAYLNIKNVAYIDIESKDFSYTTMGDKQLNHADFSFISRNDLIALFENENDQFIGLSSDGTNIYINVEAIAKVDYTIVDEGVKISVWFVNDENSYTFQVKDKDFIDKFIKQINIRLGKIEPQYVDHF